MGFFGEIGRGLLGGVAGLATGGPIGAAAGFASGLMSGSSAGRTTNVNNTSTRTTQLRAWDPQEESVVNQAMQGLGSALEGMSPEEVESARLALRDQIFGVSSQNIKDTFDTREARDYSAAAHRGQSNTSAGHVRSGQRAAQEGRQLASAGVEADLASRQIEAQQAQLRQAAINNRLAVLGQMWNQRLQGSTVVQTGAGQTVSPDTFLPSISAGLGYAVGNEDSYLNTHGILGLGGGNSNSTGNYLWDQGKQGPAL